MAVWRSAILAILLVVAQVNAQNESESVATGQGILLSESATAPNQGPAPAVRQGFALSESPTAPNQGPAQAVGQGLFMSESTTAPNEGSVLSESATKPGILLAESVGNSSMSAPNTPSFWDLMRYVATGNATPGTAVPLSRQGSTRQAAVNRALDALTVLFPEEAANINKHRRMIVRAYLAGPNAANSTMAALSKVQHAPAPADVETSSQGKVLPAALSACAEAVVSVIIDTIGVALTIVAKPPAWGKVSKSLRTLLRDKGSAWLVGWRTLITAVRSAWNARSASGMVRAVTAMIGEIFSQAGGLVFQAFKNSLSWWDWLSYGISLALALAQFTATGGAWLAVSAVSLFLGSFQLGQSLTTAGAVC